jgi:glutathione synthase/RimK-type ligase-like ATP-grasp enzyme
MSLKIFPYKSGSVSAKRLARTLGVLRVSQSYNARRKDVIVNWGSSTPPHFRWMEQDLNKPQAIALASNKLKTFSHLSLEGFEDIPQWTCHRDDAEEWINQGNTIYCRTKTMGHSGHGIVIASNRNELVNAPLYTVKTKHKHEYRVHVFKDKVLDVQMKRKRNGSLGGSGIRNHSNGWVYARAEIVPSEELLSSSIEAVKLLGLDFGAVDIGHRLIDNKFFVFEVNTAPGLEGTTLDKYSKAIYNYYRTIN